MSTLRTLPILGLTVFLFGAACKKAEPTGTTPPAPAVAPVPDAQPIEEPPPPPPPEDDCTLATPLKPGIPGSPGHLVVSTRNPNGDSELALLMRHFVEQLREARVLLAAKQAVPKLHPTFRKMRCAWPTRPAERDAAFDGRAVAFLQAVQAYDAKPGQETYNGVIGGCISCHAQSCGGPLDFIDGMKWQ
jgi:hypothetical protein